MEHIQQLLNQLKSLRNQSVHKGGFGIILSPQYFLVSIVLSYISSNNNLSSPLAQKFINSVHNNEFFPSSEIEKARTYLPFKAEDLSNEDFLNLTQGLIEECLKDMGGRNEVYSPARLNEILVNLINPQRNQVIYDPACGIGTTFVEIHKRFSNLNLKFVGQEVNQLTYLLCQINLLINGVGNAEIYNTDSIKEPLFKYENKVDFAVSEPPLISRTIRLEPEINHFIEIMLSMIRKQGRVIVVVPDFFLFSTRFENFRNEYLSRDWIEQVISLPDDLYRPISTRKASIVVFNKNKGVEGKIIFNGIDFRDADKFEKTKVNTDSIIKSDLRANRYALQSRRELDNLFRNSKYSVVRINDIVSFYKTGRPYARSHMERQKYLEELPLVRGVDLSKEDDNLTLDISKLERTAPRIGNQNLVDFQAVLCSLIGGKLKPTVFNYAERPILISPDLIALKLNKNVNVDYFLIQLKSDYVRAQLDAISDTIIYRVRTDDFLNIQLILPPLQEQARLAIESLKAIQKELHHDISEEKKEAKLAEYDIIRIIVHNLNQKLAAMQNDLLDLKTFFEEKAPHYLQEPVAQVFEDDSEDEINKIRLVNVIQRLINTRNEASAQLSATRKELQNSTISPSYLNFKKWLRREIKPLYENEIDFKVEGEDIEFDFDTNRFRDLVRNLVDNAKQNNARKVVFDLTYIYIGNKQINKDKVRILYKNDGEPFTEDFDFNLHFKRLYEKSSNSNGSGIGGFSINRTIELHNGEMNNVSPERETFDIFPVQIEFILPIKYKPNPNYVKSNPYTTD